jgi:hypothetical protein
MPNSFSKTNEDTAQKEPALVHRGMNKGWLEYSDFLD